ncbi:MAG: RNA-processing protein [Candidatus Aenigmarchaeota archaeon]|nr:RNA-processing protein [Candidatus Aenigmarchaeota archaeon]
MLRVVKIPKERLAVLIGKGGLVKKEIENLAEVKISVNEDVEIEGDALRVMNAENIVKAIGRGFSPERSMYLLDEEYTLDMIPLPKNEKALKRVRSRIIGTRGKARKNIEIMTKTFISVYGRTVSIIGRYEDAEKARGAVERLIIGHSHKSVYKSIGIKRIHLLV